ncbi:MAG: NADH-quinone oxidoreductase subunit M [Methylohalobius crimeensis]
MSPIWLPGLLFLGGLLAWLGEGGDSRRAHAIALGALLVDVGVLGFAVSGSPELIAETRLPWIPRFGIGIHLYLDGLSLALVALTLLLGVIAVLVSWREIERRAGLFQLNLLWTLAGTLGVFLAADLFLFFFAWELMIVPMFFIIRHWGHEDRARAAFKFFLFTQIGGLFLWLAILALAFLNYRQTGTFSFDLDRLQALRVDFNVGMWLMLGFSIGFLVKLPALPFHPWLPDAHTQAPTGGSVILAGVLLKTGAYGLLRFVLGLFPDQAEAAAPAFMALGAAGVLYGALQAFAQEDVKRLIAYSSVSHMGLVLLGAFAGNAGGYRGAVMTMLAHGLSAAALFAVAGMLQSRLHTRELDRFGGLWDSAPRMGFCVLFFALAALGLPGLGNFVGEFLALLGAFQSRPWISAVGALGLILAPIYALYLIQRSFHGPVRATVADLDRREAAFLGIMVIGLLWLGLNPDPVLDRAAVPENRIQIRASTAERSPAARLKGVCSQQGRNRAPMDGFTASRKASCRRPNPLGKLLLTQR